MCGWCMINVYYSDLTIKWMERKVTKLDWALAIPSGLCKIRLLQFGSFATIYANNSNRHRKQRPFRSQSRMKHQLKRQKRRRQGCKRRQTGSTGFRFETGVLHLLSMFQPLVLFAHVHGHKSHPGILRAKTIVVLLGQNNKKQPFLYLHGALKAVPGAETRGHWRGVKPWLLPPVMTSEIPWFGSTRPPNSGK